LQWLEGFAFSPAEPSPPKFVQSRHDQKAYNRACTQMSTNYCSDTIVVARNSKINKSSLIFKFFPAVAKPLFGRELCRRKSWRDLRRRFIAACDEGAIEPKGILARVQPALMEANDPVASVSCGP